MDLIEWYAGKITLPDKFGPQTMNFAASSIGLVKRFLRSELDSFKIVVRDCDSPFVMGHTIVFPYTMFSPNEIERINRKASVADTISACLGVTAHEAGHIRFSYGTISEMMETGGAKTEHKFIATFYNILEDLYIENAMIDQEYWTRWMFSSAWNYFLSNDQLESIVDCESKPSTIDESINLLYILIQAKHRDRDILTLYGDYADYAIQRCFEVMTYHNKVERYKFVQELYDELFESKVDQEMEEDHELTQQLLEELLKHIFNLVSGSKEDVDPDTSYYDNREQAFERIEDLTYQGSIDSMSGTDVPTFEIIPKTSATDILETDIRYQKLSELARQVSSKAMPKGERSKRGHRIVSPQRIVLDSKIFRKKIDSPKLKPMILSILVDCSGSMNSGSRLRDSFSAAYGAAFGVRSGGHDVSIYGHTGDINRYGPINTIIFKFKDVNESLAVAKARINGFLTTSDQVQNRDGHAIRAVVHKFPKTNRKKVLIVISDGAPEAANYSGKPGIVDTAAAVAYARAQGITVLSISITKYCKTYNDTIYGSLWNVCNDDPTVVVDIINRLLTNN